MFIFVSAKRWMKDFVRTEHLDREIEKKTDRVTF